MPPAAGGQRPAPGLYAYLTFHVRSSSLAEFCEACAALLRASSRDAGKLRMDIHRELPWANCLSNDDFSLFLMIQEWARPEDLEAHVMAPHSQRFNMALPRMLVVEPSVTIFGAPLGPSELAGLGAEATAAAMAAATAGAGAGESLGDASLPRPPGSREDSRGASLNSSFHSSGRLSGTAAAAAAATGGGGTGGVTPSRSGSRSVLAASGASSLLRK